MRKKSHISLSGYLVREMKLEELALHKKAFYLGAVLPDLNPNMVRNPHEISVAFEKLGEDVRSAVEKGRKGNYNARVLWRKIGMIIHYIADFFTFPHNSSYDGNLKDHCLYERDLKYLIREYVRSQEAKAQFVFLWRRAEKIETPQELMSYIAKSHLEYMGTSHTLKGDCQWIVRVCSAALISIAGMIEGDKGAALYQFT